MGSGIPNINSSLYGLGPGKGNKPAVKDQDLLKQMLGDSWKHYKEFMIEDNGRPICDVDKDDLDQDGNITERVTFSEGVSYVLLRAALMGDRKTFDKVWLWTQKNLQRKNIKGIKANKRDHLFAWRYHPDTGTNSTKTDIDPASDAEQDIAAALIIAHQKWGSKGAVNYRQEAQAILNDIWSKETVVISGKRVLIAGDTQKYTKNPINGESTWGVNPSYLRPTYYESLFANFDSTHDWKSMVAPSYEIIQMAADATMHNESKQKVKGKVNLVPDFIALNSSFKVVDHGWKKGDHSTNDYYWGGDAFRTLYWMALQKKVNPADQKAIEYLQQQSNVDRKDFGPHAFLKQQLEKHGTIYNGYNIDGSVHWREASLQTLSVYMLFFLAAGDTESAQKVYDVIQANYAYKLDGYWGGDQNEYYGQNWMWFALYLMLDDTKFGETVEKPTKRVVIEAPKAAELKPVSVDNNSQLKQASPENALQKGLVHIDLAGRAKRVLDKKKSKVKGYHIYKYVLVTSKIKELARATAVNWLIYQSKGQEKASSSWIRKLFIRDKVPCTAGDLPYRLLDYLSASWIAETADILINSANSQEKIDILLDLLEEKGIINSSERASFNDLLAPYKADIQINGIPNHLRYKLLLKVANYCEENKVTAFISGKTYFYLSLFAPSRKAATEHLSQAKTYLSQVINDSSSSIAAIKKHNPYVDANNEYNKWKNTSSRLLAEIDMLESGLTNNPQEKLNYYIAALAKISNILDGLKDLELIAAQEFLVNILIQMSALISRNPELKLDTFKELVEYAKAHNRTDYNIILLNWAEEHIDLIQKWDLAYRQKTNGQQSSWLRQITIGTKISEIKIWLYNETKGKTLRDDIEPEINKLPLTSQQRLDLAKDIALEYFALREKNLTTKAAKYHKLAEKLFKIAKQDQNYPYVAASANLWLAKLVSCEAKRDSKELTKALTYAEKSIKTLKKLDSAKDQKVKEDLYEAKRVQAEIKVRQAFLLIAEGEEEKQEEADKLLKNALTLLEDAKANGSAYTKASASLWLAKIYSFNASREKDKAKRRTLLFKAGDNLGHAFAKDAYGFILAGSELSAAYQTQADIFVAQKRFSDAINSYQTALKEWEYNFEAKVSLADVYAWKTQYSKALKIYQEVLTTCNGDNKLALYRAKLGIADIYNWKENYETATSMYEQTLAELKAIKEQKEKDKEPDIEIDRLIRRTEIALAEIKLRKEEYSEIEAVKAKANEILEKEPYGSPLRLRAKYLLLEVADAYLAISKKEEDDKKALAILDNMLKDPEVVSESEDGQTLAMMTHLRLARYYNSNDNKDKANEHFNEIYGLYIGGVTALRNDNSKLTNQELLMKAEALVFFKRYKEAAAIYEQVLQNPETSTRQRLDILCDYSSLFTFDDAKKKHRIEDHDRAEEYFDTIILHYSNNPDLSSKEKLLYVKALFNMAEIKRWGDNRDYDLALTYYLDALEILKDTKPAVKSVKELRARINIGLARIYEIKGDMALANQYARAANKDKEELAKVYQKAAKRAKASVSRPLVRAKHSQFRSNRGEVELREEIQVKVPVHPNIDLTATERIDHDEQPETTTSTYVGAAAHDVPLAKDTYLDVEARGKVVTTQSGRGRTEYYRQSDIETSTRVRNRYVQGELNTGHDIRHKELGTTVNTNVLFRAAGVTNIPFLRGFEVGVEYNKYNFLLNGTHMRRNISLLTRGSWSLVDDFLSIGFQANYPYFEFLPYADYTNDDSDSGTKATYHPLRGRVGGNLRLSLARWGVPLEFTAEFNYYRQFSHVNHNNKEEDYQFNETLFNLNLLNFFDWPYNR